MRREHGVTLSYSYVKQALQQAGLLPTRQSRGRHHRRREPRACFGELLHLDGSRHPWLALVPEARATLITIVDDATNALLYAQLWARETTLASSARWGMSFTRRACRWRFTPIALAGRFVTPHAKGPVDKTRLTQVGRALHQLGIEHIPAYSPQARGRSERVNRTLQGRLVNELRVAGIRAVDAANRYLRDVYLPQHNATFRRPPSIPPTPSCRSAVDLDPILCQHDERVIAPDNTVVVGGRLLQIERQPGRRTCAGLRVVVRQHLDGRISVTRPPDRALDLHRGDEGHRRTSATAAPHARDSSATATDWARTLAQARRAACQPLSEADRSRVKQVADISLVFNIERSSEKFRLEGAGLRRDATHTLQAA